MKKLINCTLIIAPVVILILITGSFLVNVAYDNVWEIRKPWFSLVSNTLIATLFALFFIALTIKPFISNKRDWIKYILSLFYFLILTFSVFLLIKKQKDTWVIITMIISTLIIALLYLIKNDKLRLIFFLIHTIIFSLISSGFVIRFISDNQTDIIAEDKSILYKMIDGNKKVILQGEEIWQKKYLISNDFIILRKRTKFEGSLPDGNWQVFGKDGEVIAIIKIKDGDEIARENLLTDNKIIVSTIRDIKNNLHKSGITLMFDGDYSFSEPIEIVNVNNIKFESIPGKVKANILINRKPCFIISGSSNISINDIELISEESDAVIKIIDSYNIKIVDSKLNCQKSSKYGIQIDDVSKNIEIRNNEFFDPVLYSIVGYSNSAIVNQNRFYIADRYNNYKSVLFKDKQFDRNTAINLVEKIILNYDERNIENNSNSIISLFGKRYINFKGNLNDLLYTYNVYNELNNFMENEYCSDCRCSYPYCSNLLELLSGHKLFLSKPTSGDRWCFDKKNDQKFSFINPEFFSWFSKKLNLQPDSLLQGVAYSFIYKNLFSNVVRDYYVVSKQLYDTKKLSNLINSYKEFVDSANSNSDIDLFLYHEFLNLKTLKTEQHFYNNSLKSEEDINLGIFYQDSKVNLYETKIYISENNNIIAKDYMKILSFWIRREIDGSASKIQDAILYYLKEYDNEWLDKSGL